MWRTILALLALAGCSSGGEQRQHAMVAAVRTGLDRLKGEPGGALARFADIRLLDGGVVCGRVDGQDGVGLRRFSSTALGVRIEQPGDAAAVAAIARTCAGPARVVTSRNPGYSDISVAEEPS